MAFGRYVWLVVVKSFIPLWIPRWTAIKPIIFTSRPVVLRCAIMLMKSERDDKQIPNALGTRLTLAFARNSPIDVERSGQCSPYLNSSWNSSDSNWLKCLRLRQQLPLGSMCVSRGIQQLMQLDLYRWSLETKGNCYC